LAQKLVDTGARDLIEGNTWGDTFWGISGGKGENNLGKLLINQREELVSGGMKASNVIQAAISTSGYSGGHNNAGKGTPTGDGKDIAMRKTADSSIVELAHDKPSSSLTTSTTLGPVNDDSKVIMLARNSELRKQPLREETIAEIKNAHARGAKFVVGDMPGVDSQFIDLLDEIGADYTIYHTGNTSRIVRRGTSTAKAQAVVSPEKTADGLTAEERKQKAIESGKKKKKKTTKKTSSVEPVIEADADIPITQNTVSKKDSQGLTASEKLKRAIELGKNNKDPIIKQPIGYEVESSSLLAGTPVEGLSTDVTGEARIRPADIALSEIDRRGELAAHAGMSSDSRMAVLSSDGMSAAESVLDSAGSLTDDSGVLLDDAGRVATSTRVIASAEMAEEVVSMRRTKAGFALGALAVGSAYLYNKRRNDRKYRF